MGSIADLKRPPGKFMISSDSGDAWMIPNVSQKKAIDAIMDQSEKVTSKTPLPKKMQPGNWNQLYSVKGTGFDYICWMSDGLFPEYFLCSKASFESKTPLWREIIAVESPAIQTIRKLNNRKYERVTK